MAVVFRNCSNYTWIPWNLVKSVIFLVFYLNCSFTCISNSGVTIGSSFCSYLIKFIILGKTVL